MHIPQDVIDEIKSNPSIKIIGISGFGGAGKSTAAALLADECNAKLVGIDSYQKSDEYYEYSYWEVMDYEKMKNEVIVPFLNQNSEEKLIIEGVGLFRPGLVDYFDYTIWVDVPLDEADSRGQKRDKEFYKNLHPQKFYDLWRENDKQCFEQYKPTQIADYILTN